MAVSKLPLRTKSSDLLGLTCEIIICHLSAQKKHLKVWNLDKQSNKKTKILSLNLTMLGLNRSFVLMLLMFLFVLAFIVIITINTIFWTRKQ